MKKAIAKFRFAEKEIFFNDRSISIQLKLEFPKLSYEDFKSRLGTVNNELVCAAGYTLAALKHIGLDGRIGNVVIEYRYASINVYPNKVIGWSDEGEKLGRKIRGAMRKSKFLRRYHFQY